jgi:NADH-quinone oxidoreductase subunit L
MLMLLGAAGKSAQIPLFVWLPDAMAGPTPVSALIHAATMVTAGVYMMVRSNVLFSIADETSFIVALIGSATAIMAGFIAVGQWDVKRVLAYSTVSQLGFMVAAVGLGAYAAAMFHLVTHAVFKALLFLGSGSIIHGMEHGHHHLHHDHHGDDGFDPQDMRFMGGLRKKMPITYWTYVLGTLALAGVFPFAGFWSKDEILADAFVVGWDDGQLKGFFTLLILAAAAGFTAFYMWRQVSMVFYGKPRHEAADHASESTALMTIPLIILGIGSILIGAINIPGGFPLLGKVFGEHKFSDWLVHSVVNAHAGDFNWWLAVSAVGLAVAAIYAARQLYNDNALASVRRHDPLEANSQTASGFALANAKLFWDENYFRFIENPYNIASRFLANTVDWGFWHNFFHERVLFGSFHEASRGMSDSVDRGLIDRGIMLVAGRSIALFSGRIRHIQTGYVRTYALTVLLGTVIVIVVILLPVIRDLLDI